MQLLGHNFTLPPTPFKYMFSHTTTPLVISSFGIMLMTISFYLFPIRHLMEGIYVSHTATNGHLQNLI